MAVDIAARMLLYEWPDRYRALNLDLLKIHLPGGLREELAGQESITM